MPIHDQSNHPIVQLMYLCKQRENTWGQDFFARGANNTFQAKAREALTVSV